MLKDFYFGKLVPCERTNEHNPKYQALLEKIQEAEIALSDLLPLENGPAMEALKNLYADRSVEEEGGAFSQGFALGVLLMMEVMKELG